MTLMTWPRAKPLTDEELEAAACAAERWVHSDVLCADSWYDYLGHD
jgi:hypothetical protein